MRSNLLRLVSASPTTSYDYSTTFVDDTWYYLEVKFVKDATNGEYRIWLNGTEVITQTGLDTSGNSDADQVRLGQTLGVTITNWVDSVVVSNSYIGPEKVAYDASDSGNDGTACANPCPVHQDPAGFSIGPRRHTTYGMVQ